MKEPCGRLLTELCSPKFEKQTVINWTKACTVLWENERLCVVSLHGKKKSLNVKCDQIWRSTNAGGQQQMQPPLLPSAMSSLPHLWLSAALTTSTETQTKTKLAAKLKFEPLTVAAHSCSTALPCKFPLLGKVYHWIKTLFSLGANLQTYLQHLSLCVITFFCRTPTPTITVKKPIIHRIVLLTVIKVAQCH